MGNVLKRWVPYATCKLKTWMVISLAIFGMAACSQERNTMTTPNASTRQPITLQNPPGTESVVLGMGCFWGAENASVS